jgi:hypothetical protein
VPNIESYGDTVMRVILSIQQSKARLESELASFVSYYLIQKEYTPNTNIAHYIDTINKSKQAMIEQLNIYFDSLKKKIEDSLQSQYRDLTSIGADTAEELINKELEALRVFETDVSTRGHLPSIIKYLSEEKQLKADQLTANI